MAFRSASGTNVRATLPTNAPRSTRLAWTVSRPDSARASSRISLMRSSTRPAFRRARSTCSAAAGDSGPWSPARRSSRGPIVSVSGVRNSWLTFANRRLRARSSSRSCSPSTLLDLEPVLETQPVHLVAPRAVQRREHERAVERVRPPRSPPRRHDAGSRAMHPARSTRRRCCSPAPGTCSRPGGRFV